MTASLAFIDALTNKPDWEDDAACRDLPWDMFFPTRGQSVDAAKAVCARCSVATECGEDALRRVIREGVRGGMSEKQRRRIRHLRRCTDEACENIAHAPAPVDPAPEWVPTAYKALWTRKRAPRRATFGRGTVESRRVARALVAASVLRDVGAA